VHRRLVPSAVELGGLGNQGKRLLHITRVLAEIRRDRQRIGRVGAGLESARSRAASTIRRTATSGSFAPAPSLYKASMSRSLIPTHDI
jgi:hypothetical protein